MSRDPREPTTTVDSLVRAVARTPDVAPPSPGNVIADNFVLLDELGRGGMGIVYRARDRRLDREVAVKLMRADRWAHVPRAELVELFEREARATARLRHPAIVTLHHAGEHDGAFYLVLELLHGRSLAARLTRPLALADAVATVRTVADAVAHAHAEGVLHRDLKPHNVLIGDDGRVWVLDFGLASLQAAGGDEPAVAAMSRAGTPAYMAPEQRAAAPQDARTDVWALGLLLYQAVTAHEPPPLLTAEDLARPPWTSDLARLPPSVARVIARAVQWRADDRHATVAALRADLDTIDVAEAAPAAPVAARRMWPWLAGGGAVAAVAAATVVAWPGSRAPRVGSPAPRAPVWFDVALTPTDFATFPQSPPVAVSPDGRALVFVGPAPDVAGVEWQLYLRRLDAADAAPIADTERVEGPTFSPDGAWIAYARDGELRKRRLDGGAEQTLAPVHAGFRGVTWTSRDELVMAPSWFSPLVVVPAGGGASRPLTTLAVGEKSHRYPHALPGGAAVVFVVGDTRSDQFDDARVEWVELATGARRVVTTGGAPKFVPPSTLLVPRAGALWAVPFDPSTGAVTGPEVRVLDDLLTSPASGVPAYDVGAAGTLAYFPGDPAVFATEVVRVDASGAATPLPAPVRATTSVRALDRDRLLLRTDAANATLWLYDLPREIDTRLTWAWDADHAVVAPDDVHLYLAVTRPDRAEIVRRRLDGTGDDEPIYTGRNPANLELSRDGARLCFDERDATTGAADILCLALDGAGAPAPVAYQATADHETQPALSPDGAWLAYTSSVSGRDEIYVQAFPASGPRVQLSAHGGRWARWRADGREVVYRDGHAVIAVAIDVVDGKLVAGPPRTRFELDDLDEPARRTFDLLGADAMVTVRQVPDAPRADRLRVAVGWQSVATPAR